MHIQFENVEEKVMHEMRGGKNDVFPRMIVDENNKIMRTIIPPGASIGVHTHEIDSEVIYVLDGVATIEYDGEIETVKAGEAHYCPKGHSHGTANNGDSDLVFFAVVPTHGA